MFSSEPIGNNPPNRFEVVEALEFAGFSRPRVDTLSRLGTGARYRVILPDCAEFAGHLFQPWIASAFCEQVEIENLYRLGEDVHLVLKLTMLSDGFRFPGCLP